MAVVEEAAARAADSVDEVVAEGEVDLPAVADLLVEVVDLPVAEGLLPVEAKTKDSKA